MTKKFICLLSVMLLICTFFSACFSDESNIPEAPAVPEEPETFSTMEPVGGIYGVYADLVSVTSTGCRLCIAGDSHFKISDHFCIYACSENGEEVPLEPVPEFNQTTGYSISEAGISMDYDWSNVYGSLPRGDYSIMFTLLEGNGSISFYRYFNIT